METNHTTKDDIATCSIIIPQNLKNCSWADFYKDLTGIVVCPDGSKQWLLNGKLHREDGPAIEYNNGYKKWFLNGVVYSESNWKKEVAKLKEKKSK